MPKKRQISLDIASEEVLSAPLAGDGNSFNMECVHRLIVGLKATYKDLHYRCRVDSSLKCLEDFRRIHPMRDEDFQEVLNWTIQHLGEKDVRIFSMSSLCKRFFELRARLVKITPEMQRFIDRFTEYRRWHSLEAQEFPVCVGLSFRFMDDLFHVLRRREQAGDRIAGHVRGSWASPTEYIWGWMCELWEMSHRWNRWGGTLEKCEVSWNRGRFHRHLAEKVTEYLGSEAAAGRWIKELEREMRHAQG